MRSVKLSYDMSVLATWDIHSYKRQLGLSPPSYFSLSCGTQPLMQQGIVSHAREKTRKTRVSLQHTLRQAMQRLHERSAKGTLIHDAVSWMHLVHRQYSRTSCTDSGYPLGVMVESTHSRNSDHLVACMMRGNSRSARFRNLLLNPLMRSCLVEVHHILIEHALELPLVKDQEVVKAFLAHTSARSVHRSR
jgi:hypothetical protein